MDDETGAPRAGVPRSGLPRPTERLVATARSWPTWVKVASGAAVGVVALSLFGFVVGGADDAGQRPVVVSDAAPTTERPTTTTVRRTTTTAPSTTTTLPPTTTTPPPPPTTPPTTAAPVVVPAPQPIVPQVPAPSPAPAPAPASSASGPFANCDAARAAGAAPVYRGDPGYAPHLDRDDDGVGCE